MAGTDNISTDKDNTQHTISPVAVLTFGDVTLVNQSRDHMTVLQVEVVMGTIDICRYDAGECAPMLVVVGPVE